MNITIRTTKKINKYEQYKLINILRKKHKYLNIYKQEIFYKYKQYI